ncbi:MAG: hypothetical protein BMS9Abin29_2397 [Gemmatimonadota bacterium]|nr:MAG: hypothetical protein BMS9Abin29_2397 [Gemmatimonadota bacterium]
MIERLEHLGVQELTLVEQSQVVGGDGVVGWIGMAFGIAAGLAVRIISAVLDPGYDNPRYSGQWMG